MIKTGKSHLLTLDPPPVALSAVPQTGFGWTKSAEPAQWTCNNKEMIFPLKEGL